jgi:hypothetical protein
MDKLMQVGEIAAVVGTVWLLLFGLAHKSRQEWQNFFGCLAAILIILLAGG